MPMFKLLQQGKTLAESFTALSTMPDRLSKPVFRLSGLLATVTLGTSDYSASGNAVSGGL